MAERVVLHVGAMKSGTSYIQARLLANQDVLGEQGILYPGKTWRDQVLAVNDVLGSDRAGPVPSDGKWQWLLERTSEWDGTVVVSMEFLGPAAPAKIRKIVDSFDGAEVHAVMSVRDLNRNIPAMWQETVQNYHPWTWPEHLRGVRARPGLRNAPGRNFWRQQDTVRIARNWSDVVGKERFTIVTVPHPGADAEVLWERFSEAVGVDAASCSPVPRSNEALGVASALVMRRLNVVLKERDLPWKHYTSLVKMGLAKHGLADRRGQEASIGFDVPRWVKKRSTQMIKQLDALGVQVVGDLADLEPVAVPGVDPNRVPERDQLDAAVAGLGDLVGLWAKDRDKNAKKQGQ